MFEVCDVEELEIIEKFLSSNFRGSGETFI